MYDLMRSYKMKLKRRPSISDSDTESQPLASSASSTTSFGTLNETCMFNNDSDTTDYECDKVQLQPTPQNNASPTIAAKSFLRRPFCFPGPYEPPVLDIYTNNETIYDRFQYFSKANGLISEDSLLAPKTRSPYTDFYSEEFTIMKQENSDTNSSVVTIFAIWNTIMGSSLLAMAWGLEKAGLIPGIVLILFIAAICLYTAFTILQVNENHGLFRNNEVPDLCRLLLGRWAECIAKVFSLIVLIGANIVYWILMSNFLYHSVNFIVGYVFFYNDTASDNSSLICTNDNMFNDTAYAAAKVPRHEIFDNVWNLYSTVPVFLAIIMFPVLNFRSATFFTKFNSLGTISVMYLVVFVAIKSYSWGINIPDWSLELDVKSSFCALSGMLSLSYFIHNIIISVVKNNRYQENNGRDLSIAFGLVTFTYLFIGVLFYVCFPLAKTCIEDNILNNFQKHDVLSLVARLLLLFQLFTVFPLIAFMLRMDILTNINMIFKDRKYGDFSYGKVMVLNVFVLTVCVLFACFLPRIGTLIRYTGALSGMVYIFTLPSLLKISSLKKEKALTPCKLIGHVLIICIGALNLLSQFFIRDA